MAAPLSIEQMILNHNIGVNMTDADTLEGYHASDFSQPGHKHSASDITSGTLGPQFLPFATTTNKGIVQLSSNTDSTDSTTAATSYAVNQVKIFAQERASATHQHEPKDLKTGAFTSRLTALSENTFGVPVIRNIIVDSSVPADTVGKDGDIYFQY
jgi:phage-related tail fiber protein